MVSRPPICAIWRLRFVPSRASKRWCSVEFRIRVVSLVAAVTPASGIKAGELIKDAARQVGGGGGGKGDIATAGGKNAAALDDALVTATQAVEAARRAK
ncbi:MAG: DHHA1 domain-containing protein [Actinomycetota bacterium]